MWTRRAMITKQEALDGSFKRKIIYWKIFLMRLSSQRGYHQALGLCPVIPSIRKAEAGSHNSSCKGSFYPLEDEPEVTEPTMQEMAASGRIPTSFRRQKLLGGKLDWHQSPQRGRPLVVNLQKPGYKLVHCDPVNKTWKMILTEKGQD